VTGPGGLGLARWIRAKLAGWWLGLARIVGGAPLGDLLGGEDSGLQFAVGVGMGVGVGYTQGRVVRGWLGAAWPWVAASTFGIGAPWVLYDLTVIRGFALPFSPTLYVVVGAALAGALQALPLRRHLDRAGWWVPASVAGWALAEGIVLIPDALFRLPGPPGAVVFLVAFLLGGLVLGAVTGAVLAWRLDRSGREFPST